MGSILDNEKRFPLFNKVKKEHDISVYIEEQNKSLHAMGYTEHSYAHIGVVADRAGYILDTLGMDDHTAIKLKLEIDTRFGEIGEYFEIFMERMLLCRKASAFLKLEFLLIINEQTLM